MCLHSAWPACVLCCPFGWHVADHWRNGLPRADELGGQISLRISLLSQLHLGLRGLVFSSSSIFMHLSPLTPASTCITDFTDSLLVNDLVYGHTACGPIADLPRECQPSEPPQNLLDCVIVVGTDFMLPVNEEKPPERKGPKEH